MDAGTASILGVVIAQAGAIVAILIQGRRTNREVRTPPDTTMGQIITDLDEKVEDVAREQGVQGVWLIRHLIAHERKPPHPLDGGAGDDQS